MAMLAMEPEVDMVENDGATLRHLPVAGIPRKIHYVWFGGQAKPAGMEALIDGWRKLMPDYEVIEWNDSNLDVTSHPWMARMYAEGKFAFASDYARLKVLWEHGGIYLDTDVVVKKSFDPFLRERCLLSFEFDSFLSTCFIAVVPRHPLIRALLSEYDTLEGAVVNNALITEYFLRTFPEFRLNNRDQRVGRDIRILPKEYFVIPSFDKRKNFAVHRANNHWAPKRGGLRFGPIVRGVIGDVLFYKLVNVRMNMKSDYQARDRARRKR